MRRLTLIVIGLVLALGLGWTALSAQGILTHCGTVTNDLHFTILVSSATGTAIGRVPAHATRRFCVGR